MRHPLQRSILNSLATAKTRRYSDMNIDKLDGNVFTYHLKQLLRDKLVQQNRDGSYSLTRPGKHYIIHRHEDPALSAHSIFLVIIRHRDMLLLRKRLVQPMIDYSGFVHGEPIAGEPIEQTVKSRVFLKTGLELHTINVHSSGLVQISVNNHLDTFSHVILITAEINDDQTLALGDATGENFWINESKLNSVSQLLPSCLDLLEHSNTSRPWFYFDYTL